MYCLLGPCEYTEKYVVWKKRKYCTAKLLKIARVYLVLVIMLCSDISNWWVLGPPGSLWKHKYSMRRHSWVSTLKTKLIVWSFLGVFTSVCYPFEKWFIYKIQTKQQYERSSLYLPAFLTGRGYFISNFRKMENWPS